MCELNILWMGKGWNSSKNPNWCKRDVLLKGTLIPRGRASFGQHQNLGKVSHWKFLIHGLPIILRILRVKSDKLTNLIGWENETNSMRMRKISDPVKHPQPEIPARDRDSSTPAVEIELEIQRLTDRLSIFNYHFWWSISATSVVPSLIM